MYDLKLVESNLKKLYNLVLGNCTDGVHALLQSEEEYEEKEKAFNYTWILQMTKKIVSGVDTITI